MILNLMIFADTEKGKKMRLIDKRELMKLLDDMFSRYDGTPSVMEGFKYGLDAVISEVSVMPTIEAEPVIKCKDCIYNKGEVNKKGFIICSANGMDITDYDYCSWGEKMDKGEEE